MEAIHDRVTLESISQRLDALGRDVAYLAERQRKQEELFAEMTPILKEIMATATTRLDGMEKKGYFAFGNELLRVAERVVEGYSPDDVRQLGDAVVGILDTVRAMTQPEVLAIAGEASEVLQHADRAEPVGLVGMVRASRNDDVQKGMAVMLDLLRHVGRGAKAFSDRKEGAAPVKRRVALGAGEKPQKPARKVLGTERPAKPAACAAPPPAKGAAVTMLDGVGFTADGHLADPSQWTRALGETIAAAQGVTMTEAHWNVVLLARHDFESAGASPNVRRLTQIANLGTKELYALFPKAPARTIAKIAGIPKPAGCI
jgi:tRNA 2-thiouridine synthesizing protein E